MSDQKPPRTPPAAAKPRQAAAKKAPAKKAAAKPAVARPAVAKQVVAKTPAPKDGAGKPQANGDRKRAAQPATPASAPASASAPGSAPAPDEAHPDLIRVPMAVRWRDLDAFNHVNNSKYLSYLEEARLHWMLGVPGQGMDDHVAPVVAAAQLNYRRPITWPAQVMIELFVERLGNTSLSIGHRIVDDADRSIVYCDGNVVMVWIDRDSGRAAALPASVREACNDIG